MTISGEPDYFAPKDSESRLLCSTQRDGLCHRTLPTGRMSSPAAHPHIEEICYVVERQGNVWHRACGTEDIVHVSAGTSLTIFPRVAFPFRNTGADTRCILIVTMSPWASRRQRRPSAGGPLWSLPVQKRPWRRGSEERYHDQPQPLLLPLRVLHESAASAVESGGAILRQAVHPRSDRCELGAPRRGSPRPGGSQAVVGPRHPEDGDAGGCPGDVRRSDH